ncbi:DEKNAAC101623 [Brettanomyces naardenensis]|uniref:Mediator of RNA polymerase II transcription subunit 12 n=1 Tax=Brettanomyces naardenensis TaxID=13370 RepID=A0A448YIB1_BRENA|nr:DEKNAAC101623 [Brettanomyces naardenensis]
MSRILSAADGQVPRPEGVYALNDTVERTATVSGKPSLPFNSSRSVLSQSEPPKPTPVYPDFEIWKHAARDDTRMRNHLQKGYFEPPVVSNECHSGRQTLTQLLHNGSDDNTNDNESVSERIVKAKLNSLSDAMIKVIAERRSIKKIRGKSTYKPPPRVTLTEHKREMWLDNLANPSVPLKQLSKAIPHGLRNKTLFEQCLNHKLPISRAIWLIKCVSSNEQRQLKRKAGNTNAAYLLSNRWIIEWTDQIAIFVEHVYDSCFEPKFRDSWKFRLDYTFRLATNLYLQELLNQETFLSWMVQYLGRIAKKITSGSVLNFRTLSLHYLLIRLFWFRLIKVDYLSKELGENMLFVVAKLYELPRDPKFDAVAQKLSENFQYLVKYLFYYNSDNFIIPNNWYYLKPHLRRLLDMSMNAVSEQFKLITYRNESLMIDETDRRRAEDNTATKLSYCYNKISQMVFKLDNYGEDDNEDSVTALHELSKSVFSDSSSDWRRMLAMALQWSITTDREIHTESQRSSLVCSVLQTRLHELSQLKPKKFRQLKLELEAEITEFVYKMSATLNYGANGSFSLCNFLILVNRLYRMDLFVVSSYLRRLIASGIIYLSQPDRSCYIHLLILHSLPPLKDSNASNILKRLSDTTGIAIPTDRDVDMVSKTEKKLENYIERLFDDSGKDSNGHAYSSPGSFGSYNSYGSYDIFYDLIDSCQWPDNEDDTMQIGRKFELGTFFLDKLGDKFASAEKPRLILNVTNLTILYRLMKDHFHRYPRFTQLIFEKLDEGEIEMVDSEAFSLLLKLSSYNRRLLDSYLIDADNTIWQDITRICKEWIEKDRFHIKWLLEISKLSPSPPSRLTSYQSSLSAAELSQLGISSLERLSNAAEYSHHFSLTMSQYLNLVKGFNPQLRQSVLQLVSDLRNWKPDDFDNLLAMYLKKFIQPTLSLDYGVDLKLILKLVMDDLIDLSKIFELFAPTSRSKMDEFSSNSNRRLHWDLLFNQDLDLDDHEFLLICFERDRFMQRHPNSYYEVMLTFLSGDELNETGRGRASGQDVEMGGVDDVVPVDVMNSLHELANVSVVTPIESHRRNDTSVVKDEEGDTIRRKSSQQVVDSTWRLAASYMDIFVEMFYESKEVSCDNIRHFFFDGVMKLRPPSGDSEDDVLASVDELIRSLNYCNLHVCQWLFKDLIENKLFANASDNEYELNSTIANAMTNMLSRISELKPPKDIYLVGELFEFVSSDYKLKILSSCEDLYLGGDTFPRFAVGSQGDNMTNYLTNIISSCSRLKEYEPGQIPMSDALVFSLNLSLEKLISFCHGLERRKKVSSAEFRILESAIKLISKIILIHKNFLVDLVMKRSVNLQRDVLLLNLMKLFNTRLMDKNLRLKNLLYDILLSIKVLISEAVAGQYQKQQQGGLPLQPATLSPLSRNIATPSSSFVSPVESPLPSFGTPQSDAKNKGTIPWRTSMAINPPSVNNKLKFLLSKFSLKDALATKHSNYFLVDEETERMTKYNFRRFDMIEDASPYETMNNSSLSLQLFDCSIERMNPS